MSDNDGRMPTSRELAQDSNGAAKELKQILWLFKRQYNEAIEKRDVAGAETAHAEAVAKLEHLIEQSNRDGRIEERQFTWELINKIRYQHVDLTEAKAITLDRLSSLQVEQELALSTDTDGLASEENNDD